MSQYNDNKRVKLQIQLGVGPDEYQMQDLEQMWLMQETAGTGSINDLWHLLFDQALIEGGQFNDRMMEWLSGQGFAQESLQDRLAAYWSIT